MSSDQGTIGSVAARGGGGGGSRGGGGRGTNRTRGGGRFGGGGMGGGGGGGRGMRGGRGRVSDDDVDDRRCDGKNDDDENDDARTSVVVDGGGGRSVPRNFGIGRGGVGRGAGVGGRLGGGGRGRGTFHVGDDRHRPDRVIPILAADDDDDDEDDDDDDEDMTIVESRCGGGVGGGGGRRRDDDVPARRRRRRRRSTDDDDTSIANDATIAAIASSTTHDHCLICYSSNLVRRRAFAPCGHDDVCWTCHLQMRYLHADRKCPVCKSDNDALIVIDVDDARSIEKYSDYPTWGDEVVGPQKYVLREDVGMHFPSDLYHGEVSALLGYGCGMPHCEYNDIGDMYVIDADGGGGGGGGRRQGQQRRSAEREDGGEEEGDEESHLRIEHGYALCDLCVENKRDFASRLCRYTPRGLRDHETRGDGDRSGFGGHPLCEFCKPTRFYDVVKLHEHLNREHYKCHVCDKSGKPNVFFKDYPNLERHFDRDHYICRDPQCLAARFVVFENEIDLRGHEVSVHGATNGGNAKIRLEFRIRREGDDSVLRDHQSVPNGDDFRYGLDGEAFVPEALPDEARARQTNEPEITHPLHAARTAELRAQAARVRARDGIVGGVGGVAEAFPALGSVDPTDHRTLLVGWTSDGARALGAGAVGRGRSTGGLTRTAVGRVTEEEFPSLAPPPKKSTGRIERQTKKQPANTAGVTTGPKFSVVAASSRSTPTSTSIASSYASTIPRSAPTVNGENVPRSFGPSALIPLSSSSSSSSRAAMPNLTSADNFPSLGASRSATNSASNPYAAVQAHARKLNNKGGAPAPSFVSSDFPPPPSSSGAAKNKKIVDAFAPKKPPPLDNVLHFPPPQSTSSSLSAKKPLPPSVESLETGRETVQSLKELLGAARYKRLRNATRDFASGMIRPERYVDEAASLFDNGISDGAFWDNIPQLICDIPNAEAANGAMVYLESIRMTNELQELEFGGVVGSGGKKPTKFVLPTKKNKTANSWAK
ncbi:hypothetical protein ACHAXA_004411 [Cyclostephanos tholiformis]|uniref:RING-type domain-containing protein n=1 Tax=Cyclostephanos tholiformis TaxID=382380 RepID=A0ABD3R8P9_9STRA